MERQFPLKEPIISRDLSSTFDVAFILAGSGILPNDATPTIHIQFEGSQDVMLQSGIQLTIESSYCHLEVAGYEVSMCRGTDGRRCEDVFCSRQLMELPSKAFATRGLQLWLSIDFG